MKKVNQFLLASLTFCASLSASADIYDSQIMRFPDDQLEEYLEMLEGMNGKVLNHRDDLYLVTYPREATTRLEAMRRRAHAKKGIFQPSINLERPKAVPAMNVARTFNNAPDIYTGVGVPQPFDGTGVMVGFSDIGFDTRHVNFLNADGTASRIKGFYDYQIGENIYHRLTDTDSIYDIWSDTSDETHATHVAGILAGRGNPSPFIGMAPGADILAATSDLTDVGILAGVEDIIAHAKREGKPCVINLSVGSYNGAHDGTSLFSQYLDKCAEDAIIVISSGNSGNSNGHLGHTFLGGEEEHIKFRYYDCRWAYRDIISFMDIYSNDATPMKFQIFLVDSATSGGPIAYTAPEIDFSVTPNYVITTFEEYKGIEDDTIFYDEELAKYFNGEIYFQSEIDPENGRYHAVVYINATTDILVSDTKQWGRYQFGGYVRGSKGQRIDMYTDCQYSAFRNIAGYMIPDNDMSISDMATGHKTISVGAFWTQGSIPMFSGESWAGGTPGTVGAFSGYGTLEDGRVTPLTIAPGGPIVSSKNGQYVKMHGNGGCSWNYESEYWGPDTGTSMASPYVAGVIATWLQANPTLTFEDVQEILAATNSYDTPQASTSGTTDNTDASGISSQADEEHEPRLANGFLNPYAGLRLVVDKLYSDVQTIAGESLFANFEAGVLNIANPDRREVSIELYATDGTKLQQLPVVNSETISIQPSALNPSAYKGVGICRITAPGAPSKSLKILFK